MNATDVRNDLKSIKYYYDRQTDMDIACKTVGQSAIKRLVDKYNAAIKEAKPQLLDLYAGLYINGSTQEVFAEDSFVSAMTIHRRHAELIQYFLKALAE